MATSITEQWLAAARAGDVAHTDVMRVKRSLPTLLNANLLRQEEQRMEAEKIEEAELRRLISGSSSLQVVADVMGLSYNTIKRRMNRYGIKARTGHVDS